MPIVFLQVIGSPRIQNPQITETRTQTAGMIAPNREISSVLSTTSLALMECPTPLIKPAMMARNAPADRSIFQFSSLAAIGKITIIVPRLSKKAATKGLLIPLARITNCQLLKNTPASTDKITVFTGRL